MDDNDVRNVDAAFNDILIDDDYDSDPDVRLAIQRSRHEYTQSNKHNQQIERLQRENRLREEKFRRENREREERLIQRLKEEKERDINRRSEEVKYLLSIVNRLCRTEPKEKYMCNNIKKDINNYVDNGELISMYVYHILIQDMKINEKKISKDIFKDEFSENEENEEDYQEDYNEEYTYEDD